MTTKILWVSGISYNLEDFDPTRDEQNTEDSFLDSCVYTAQPSSTLTTQPTRTFWVIKRKEKSWLYFYTTKLLPFSAIQHYTREGYEIWSSISFLPNDNSYAACTPPTLVVNMRIMNIWKSDLTDKMKRSFFQAAVVSILLYGCTPWTLTKRLEKKLDGNYTIMLKAILNKSWRQHPTKHQLYGHLPPISNTIQVRRTRKAGHCWRSKDELISDVFILTPTYGRAKAGRPARTYI